jgi:hypothetical protein
MTQAVLLLPTSTTETPWLSTVNLFHCIRNENVLGSGVGLARTLSIQLIYGIFVVFLAGKRPKFAVIYMCIYVYIRFWPTLVRRCLGLSTEACANCINT